MRKSKIYIALLHYPMYNKRMDVVTTSVTNLDLHDIARAARTYDVDGFFVVHPSLAQHKLINDILNYWKTGYGGIYNSDRQEAFALTRLRSTLDEVRQEITDVTGRSPRTVATDARKYAHSVGYRDLKQKICQDEAVYLLLFGTGWGMSKELMEQCDIILEPVEIERSYNHLSVRSAVAIILDRLLGEY